MTLDGRQVPRGSTRINREALFKSIPGIMRELAQSDAGRFVAIYVGGRCVADTRDEADEMARGHIPRIVLQVPPPEELESEGIVRTVGLAIIRVDRMTWMASGIGVLAAATVASVTYLLTGSGFLAGMFYVSSMQYATKRATRALMQRTVRP